MDGSKFGVHEAVDIYFDTGEIALASTNGGGAFSGIEISVPRSAVPGIHWVTAVGRHSGIAAQKRYAVHTDWPQYIADDGSNRSNRYENALAPSNVAQLHQVWRTGTTDWRSIPPVVADGILYAVEGSDLVALNLVSGSRYGATPLLAPCSANWPRQTAGSSSPPTTVSCGP